MLGTGGKCGKEDKHGTCHPEWCGIMKKDTKSNKQNNYKLHTIVITEERENTEIRGLVLDMVVSKGPSEEAKF